VIAATPAGATAFVHVEDIRMQSPKARDEAQAQAEERGAKAERARIRSIINCTEAQYREKLALHIAINSEMTLQEARDLLITAGKGAA
jgi:hypothetical protein